MTNFVVYLYIIYRILLSTINPIYAESYLPNLNLYVVTGVQTFIGNPHLPNIVWYTTIPVPWKSGKVILSGNPDGTGNSDVGVQLEIYGSDQTKRFFYDGGCSEKPMPPLDITHLMGPKYPTENPDRLSNIFIRYNRKNCANSIKIDGVSKAYYDISPLYLVHFKEDIRPEPFLNLPFEYEKSKLSFEEALLGASSFFDHEFPLLSSAIKEPEDDQIGKTTVVFGDTVRSSIPYSSHDGYDFARRSGVKLGAPVLAAASGTATARWYGGCGQMIEIDHHNGFQTRYCHLSTENLVTTSAPVAVSAGQKIGEVGLTGNTTGAHIHFVVVQDKNGDSKFEDNIPDGVVDPLGFLQPDKDPWPSHIFTQNGVQKTGNKSSYLFNEKLSGGTYTVTPDGAKITVGSGDIDIPAVMVKKDSILKAEVLPPAFSPKIIGESSTDIFASWGNRIRITMHDGFNNSITKFDKAFKLAMNLSIGKNIPIDLSTVAIYSSQDGINWQKEVSSFFDEAKGVIYADIDHLSEFVVLGKLKSDLNEKEIAEWTGTWETHIKDPEITETLMPTPTPALTNTDKSVQLNTPAPTLTPLISITPIYTSAPASTKPDSLITTLTGTQTQEKSPPSETKNKSEKQLSSNVKTETKRGEVLGSETTVFENTDRKKNFAQFLTFIIFLGFVIGVFIWIVYGIKSVKKSI